MISATNLLDRGSRSQLYLILWFLNKNKDLIGFWNWLIWKGLKPKPEGKSVTIVGGGGGTSSS